MSVSLAFRSTPREPQSLCADNPRPHFNSQRDKCTQARTGAVLHSLPDAFTQLMCPELRLWHGTGLSSGNLVQIRFGPFP